MKKSFLALAAITISSQLCAQQDSLRTLDEVVITASKYPRKQSETGKVLTVITRRQIEENAGKTLAELLNTVPGTNIIGANSNLGTNLTTSIRGASAGNVLILIDGIPVNDPSVISNYFDLNFIALDQVARIEVLKGGQSTLYGSDAVAGVINIITQRAATGTRNTQATLAAGSYGTFRQDAGINGAAGKFTYNAGYSHLQSKGFSAAHDQGGNANFDKDGINQHSGNIRLGWQLSKRWQASVMGRLNYYKADLDAAAFTDERDYAVKNTQGQLGTGFTFTHTRGKLHLNYNFNYVERDYRDDSTYKSSPYVDFSKSNYIGRTHFAEVYNNWIWKDWELLAGADWRLQNTLQNYFSVSSTGPYAADPLRKDMTQVSPYASLVYKAVRGLHLEAGGRWNHHSEYGNNFTFNFNPAYQVSPSVKAYINLYTAFKAPTLYQLFDPYSGNAELNPEKAKVGEAGFEWKPVAGLRTRITGFYRRTNNSIQYITLDPANYISQYTNISRQDNYGVEAEASYQTGRWTIDANYTFTDGETRSRYDGTGAPLGKDTTYFNLYRIPRHLINLQVGYRVTKLLLIRASLRSVSPREEFIYGASPEKLKAYALIDLFGEYRFSKKLRLFADFKNITNSKYIELRGYNTRGFNFMGGVAVQF